MRECILGKRSEFLRVERDYYRTFDPKAGEALKSFIPDDTRYAEPFAGKGDLIWNLKLANIKASCPLRSDIEPKDVSIEKFDAFDIKKQDFVDKNIDMIITNPPWSRPVLHKTIEYFAPMITTWLLLDANWLFTKQAKPYIDTWLTDVVTIGRLKWIEGTTMSGKDDCLWYKFSPNKETNFVRFYGR